MEEKVDFKEIQKLENQKVEKNEAVDAVDGIDRGTGRILSRIGKWVTENW